MRYQQGRKRIRWLMVSIIISGLGSTSPALTADHQHQHGVSPGQTRHLPIVVFGPSAVVYQTSSGLWTAFDFSPPISSGYLSSAGGGGARVICSRVRPSDPFPEGAHVRGDLPGYACFAIR